MDKIDEVFELAPVEVIHNDKTVTVVPPGEAGKETDTDFSVARANHYQILQQASDAMDIALKVLRETENPRAVEAFSTLLKTVSEVNKQLLNLNEDKGRAKAANNQKNAPQGGTNIQANNVVFTGSSSDLAKMLKEPV